MTTSRTQGRLITLFMICAQIFLLRPLASLGKTIPGTKETHISATPVSMHISTGPPPNHTSTSPVLEFNYVQGSQGGPEHWGLVSPQWKLCRDGREQSPIAIDMAKTTINEDLGNLYYTYRTSTGNLINVGHTVQVNFGTNAGSLVLGADTYYLKQLHFHTPSEHVINNVRFPLEMHLVHQTSDDKKRAVIAVLFWKSCSGKFLDQLMDLLPDVVHKDANVNTGPLSFEKLHLGPNYARYRGSLTTPPCTQSVSWTVELSQRNTITQSQLDALKMVITEPNARPVQPNINSVETYCDC
ncbi:unnamed protein product [Calypogeia fissa]